MRLKDPPGWYDRFGRACYRIRQTKGLAGLEPSELTRGAVRAGYSETVRARLCELIQRELGDVRLGRKLDILDVGGGSGRLFDLLKDSTRSYLNVDPSDVEPDVAALARLEHPAYRWVRCSAEVLPLEDECVDVAIAKSSLDHIPDYRRALAEIRRVLRGGGVLIVTINNRGSWWKTLLAGTRWLDRRQERIAEDHYIQWTLAECTVRLGEYLPTTKGYSTTFFPYFPGLWRVCLPLLDRVGAWLAPAWGGNSVVVCRKGAGAPVEGTG